MGTTRYFGTLSGFRGQLICPFYCIDDTVRWTDYVNPYYNATIYDGETVVDGAVHFDIIHKRCTEISDEHANYLTDGAFA